MTDLLNRPWSIAPLAHKYYGTIIVDADGNERVKLWLTTWDGDDVPSERELGDESLEEFWEWCSDSHWETERAYQTCALIVDAVNSYELS